MSDEGRVDQNEAMSAGEAQEPTAPGARPPRPVLGDEGEGPSASRANALKPMPDLGEGDGGGEEPTTRLEGSSDATAQAESAMLIGDDPEMQAAAAALEERHARDRRARTIRIAIGAAALAAIVIALVVSSIVGKGSSGTSTQSETVAVERGDLVGDVQASAKIAPARNVDVVAEVAGTVQEVKVSEGQHVEAGAELFVLKSDDVSRSVASAGTALERARNAANDANRSVANAQRDYEQAVSDYNAEVAARNNAISQAEADADAAYQQAYNEAVAEIPVTATSAERNSLLAQARDYAQEAYNDAYNAVYIPDPGTFDHTTYTDVIAAAQSTANDVNLSLTEAQRDYDAAVAEGNKLVVRAPIAGTVTSVATKVGASVGGLAGSGALCQVIDTNSLCVDVEVGEADVAAIKNGQDVTVTLPALPGVALDGKVTKVATTSTAFASSGSVATSDPVAYQVEVTIANADERVKPGMSADVSIRTQDVPDTLLVPASAVVVEGGDAYVMVPPASGKGALEHRSVVVAGRSSTQCAISKGLSEGELVLVSPIEGVDSSTTSTTSASTGTQGSDAQATTAEQGTSGDASATQTSTATGATTSGKAS